MDSGYDNLIICSEVDLRYRFRNEAFGVHGTSVEAAIKFMRQYFKQMGNSFKYKVISNYEIV